MNKIILAGKITGDIEFSHEIHNERFYSFNLSTNRKSGVADVVPCIVSEVFVDSLSNRKDGNICTWIYNNNNYYGCYGYGYWIC